MVREFFCDRTINDHTASMYKHGKILWSTLLQSYPCFIHWQMPVASKSYTITSIIEYEYIFLYTYRLLHNQISQAQHNIWCKKHAITVILCGRRCRTPIDYSGMNPATFFRWAYRFSVIISLYKNNYTGLCTAFTIDIKWVPQSAEKLGSQLRHKSSLTPFFAFDGAIVQLVSWELP